MSKKNFKKAIGGLYKENVIEILEDKIKLIRRIRKRAEISALF
jgi:predicted RNA-binding protein (virulence factor B family)